MKKRLLIATHNPAKLSEYKRLLKNIPYNVISLSEINIKRKIKEPGKNYKENAILKARGYAKLSGLMTLSDDGGLEIKALGGWPSIYSRRIKGKVGTDRELIDYTLYRMKELPKSRRQACLKVVICLAFPDGRYFLSKGEIKGVIAQKPCRKVDKGFPFRSILLIHRFKKYFVYLSRKEQEQINHRKKALKKIIKILKK
jgi:XTP/dITP diphosphohydrolase